MRFISLVDEIQVMLISNRHTDLHKVYATYETPSNDCANNNKTDSHAFAHPNK